MQFLLQLLHLLSKAEHFTLVLLYLPNQLLVPPSLPFQSIPQLTHLSSFLSCALFAALYLLPGSHSGPGEPGRILLVRFECVGEVLRVEPMHFADSADQGLVEGLVESGAGG
jgi:hypothetical protein